MKKTSARVSIIIILLLTIVVGFYAYLANIRKAVSTQTSMTAIETALSRDLSLNYPPTPKEVIKFYNQILKCYYNEECTDEEIESLGNKARELYDAELLQANEPGTYMMKLKSDIKEFKDQKRRLTNCALASSTSVDTFSEDGFDFARISCGYTFAEGSQSRPSKIVYLLRRDETKKWKIYGWDLAENVDLNLAGTTEE